MKKILSLCLLSFFLLSLLTSPGYSQKASDILDKMIDAQGGREVLATIKDVTISGSIEIIAMGAGGLLTVYHKEPNKLRMDIEIIGMVITVATDGETVWMINPLTGSTEEMSGKDAEEIYFEEAGADTSEYKNLSGWRKAVKVWPSTQYVTHSILLREII